MSNVRIILLIGLYSISKVHSTTTQCSNLYAQCGGTGYQGSTQCCSPATCQYSNPWYSQCLSGTATSTSPSTTGASSGSTGSACGIVYSQCGGIVWAGPTNCCSGSMCTFNSQYYSQCLPVTTTFGGSATPTSPVTSSATTLVSSSRTTTGASTPSTTVTSRATSTNPTTSRGTTTATTLVSSSRTTTGASTPSTTSTSRATSTNPTTSRVTITATTLASSSHTTTGASTPSTTVTSRATSTTPTTSRGTTTATTLVSSSRTTTGASTPSTTVTNRATSTNPTTSRGTTTATTLVSSSHTTTGASTTVTSRATSTNPTTSRLTISSSSSSSSSASTTVTSNPTSTSGTTQTSCSTTYGQCGGTGWTGPTTCCSGSNCIVSNQYYSQCLPTASSASPSTASSSPVSPSTVPSGSIAGVTTRYWDCCKASCAWPGKASVSNPVKTCEADGITAVDPNLQSVCNGGGAYMCNNQQPWSVNANLSYGYAAANIAGQSESTWCCACYSLVFTSGLVIGKQLIVQVTNTGGDLGNNHFDLQMPGGGVGIFNGCITQFPGNYNWGAQYGGVSQRSDCAQLPAVVQSGCYWRFDWFMNADNPTMNFRPVTCPGALTANTQCVRN